MIGVTGGVGFFDSKIFSKVKVGDRKTKYGTIEFIELKDIVFIPRHGLKKKVPPHKINHRANMTAFLDMGITKVIGVNSTGSLKTVIPPPQLVIPDDYIDLWQTATIFDGRIVHVVPGLDEKLRKGIILKAESHQLKVRKRGVYIQTRGPRLETKAEIAMLARFGDIVGMTMASEATLAAELQIAYASICSVDNFAHGIGKEALTNKIILKNARINSDSIRELLFEIAGEL